MVRRELGAALGVLGCALACLVCVSCGSVGQAHRPVDSQPIIFVDAKSGATISRVLVVPQYSSATGVSSGGGHGPGYMVDKSFMSFPMIYLSGETFRPVQPDSTGLLLGPVVFVGQGVSLNGITVLASRYKPRYLWDLWDRPRGFKVALEPLAPDEAPNQERRLQGLLEQDRIRSADLTDVEREALVVSADTAVSVRFTSKDRQLVREFFSQSRGPIRFSAPSAPPC